MDTWKIMLVSIGLLIVIGAIIWFVLACINYCNQRRHDRRTERTSLLTLTSFSEKDHPYILPRTPIMGGASAGAMV